MVYVCRTLNTDTLKDFHFNLHPRRRSHSAAKIFDQTTAEQQTDVTVWLHMVSPIFIVD